MVDENDIARIKANLTEFYDARYRKIEDCEETVKEIIGMQNKDNVRLAVIENQLKLILWVLTAVGGGVITIMLKMFIGG